MIAFILRRHQTFMLVSPFCDSHPILCRACRVAILHAEMNPAKASQVPLGLLHTALEAQGLEKDNGECTGEGGSCLVSLQTHPVVYAVDSSKICLAPMPPPVSYVHKQSMLGDTPPPLPSLSQPSCSASWPTSSTGSTSRATLRTSRGSWCWPRRMRSLASPKCS